MAAKHGIERIGEATYSSQLMRCGPVAAELSTRPAQQRQLRHIEPSDRLTRLDVTREFLTRGEPGEY
jgi:hypothetical protein